MPSSNETATQHEGTLSLDRPSQEYPKEIIDLWKKVREIYKQKRDSKSNDRKYRTLKRFTERRRLETMRKDVKGIWKRACNLFSYRYRKRPLKRNLAIMLEQEQARYDHLKEKEEKKAREKTRITRAIRHIRGYRPHSQRLKRLRGKYGKEQGDLQQIKEIREKYQKDFSAIQEYRAILDKSYEKVEKDINRLFGENMDTERGQEAFNSLGSYKMLYMRKSGKFIDMRIDTLHAKFTEEMQGMERRIKHKISWNDIASIGSGPVTVAGTLATIVPLLIAAA